MEWPDTGDLVPIERRHLRKLGDIVTEGIQADDLRYLVPIVEGGKVSLVLA